MQRVSEHAIIRFMERVLRINVNYYRQFLDVDSDMNLCCYMSDHGVDIDGYHSMLSTVAREEYIGSADRFYVPKEMGWGKGFHLVIKSNVIVTVI